MQKHSTESMNDTFQKLNEKADILYHFVLLYSDYINQTRDYGTNQELTLTEAHMLLTIEKTPDITVTELAEIWNRTKGAISQTVTRLENKGLIIREKREGNKKTTYLKPTKEGQKINQLHKIYDIKEITETTGELLKTCDLEEIDTFYKVLEAYIDILKK